MKTRMTSLLLGLFVFAVPTPDVLADEAARAEIAATEELPSALLALNSGEVELLTERQAGAVRGQWILRLDFPLVRTVIEGHGTFQTRLLTLSGGAFGANPILVQLRVGR